MLKFIHSYFAYLVITILFLSTLRFLIRYLLSKDYTPVDFRLALVTLITSHTQLLIGLFLYFISPNLSWWNNGFYSVIANPDYRLYLIEHPVINIIAIILITRGYSLHKKKRVSNSKFKTIAIHYLLGLVLLLYFIPWKNWM
jgi:hypothetical protein